MSELKNEPEEPKLELYGDVDIVYTFIPVYISKNSISEVEEAAKYYGLI